MNEQQTTAHSVVSEQYDDISALGEAFSLRAFRYVDIARQERLAAILLRWPLLEELALTQDEGSN